MGEGLNSILQSPIFESIKEDLEEISNQIKNAELVQLMAPADLDGILALAQLEASFLDLSLKFKVIRQLVVLLFCSELNYA